MTLVITSIEKDIKKGGFSVFIDGVYSFSIREEDFYSFQLYEKREISEDELNRIKEELKFSSAKSAAMSFLSFKYRTCKEVLERLKRRGFDRDTAERVVDELKALGYINDRLYAQKYIYEKRKLKPMSKARIRDELLARGVDRETVDEVLSEWETDDFSVAAGLVKRRFGKYSLSDENVRKRVYNFLRYRGYNGELISQVYNKLLEEEKSHHRPKSGANPY